MFDSTNPAIGSENRALISAAMPRTSSGKPASLFGPSTTIWNRIGESISAVPCLLTQFRSPPGSSLLVSNENWRDCETSSRLSPACTGGGSSGPTGLSSVSPVNQPCEV